MIMYNSTDTTILKPHQRMTELLNTVNQRIPFTLSASLVSGGAGSSLYNDSYTIVVSGKYNNEDIEHIHIISVEAFNLQERDFIGEIIEDVERSVGIHIEPIQAKTDTTVSKIDISALSLIPKGSY